MGGRWGQTGSGLRAGRDGGEEERRREGGLDGHRRWGGRARAPGGSTAPEPRGPSTHGCGVRRGLRAGRCGDHRGGGSGRGGDKRRGRGQGGGRCPLSRQGCGPQALADGRLRNPRGHVGAVVTENADGKCQGLAQQCRLRPESRRCVGAGPRRTLSRQLRCRGDGEAAPAVHDASVLRFRAVHPPLGFHPSRNSAP